MHESRRVRNEELQLASLIAILFAERKQLLVVESIANSVLPDLCPVDGEFGLIFVRDLQLVERTCQSVCIFVDRKQNAYLGKYALANESCSHSARDIYDLQVLRVRGDQHNHLIHRSGTVANERGRIGGGYGRRLVISQHDGSWRNERRIATYGGWTGAGPGVPARIVERSMRTTTFS